MPTGEIIQIKNKYVILNDTRKINITNIHSNLLPNDTVEYEITSDDCIEIKKIIKRKIHITFGIIESLSCNISNGETIKKFILRCPELSKIFKPTIPFNSGFSLYDVVLIRINAINHVDIYDDKININDINMNNTYIDFNEYLDNGIYVIRYYGSIMSRDNDINIFKDLYNFRNDPNIVSLRPEYLYDYTNTESNYYKEQLQLNTFTVDPKNSKDFDDAISIDSDNNIIYIHIVDAHKQVKINSEEDIQAFIKAFTFYSEEGNVNMLPDNLAEDDLSLVAGEERFVLTIEIYIDDKTQNILEYSLYNSLIKVKDRYTYEEFIHYKDLYPMLVNFCNKWKKKSLNIPFFKPIIERNSGKMINYKLISYNDVSHKIIETLMIIANLLVSMHVLNSIPQRYHEKVNDEHKPDCIEAITGNEAIDSILAIKKYKNALYKSNTKGHYALDLDSYTHFTSPIRRYFDIIVHRILAGVSYANLEELLDYINSREVENERLYKIYKNLKILDFLQDNMSLKWNGYVIDITSNGYSVIIDELMFNIFVFNSNCFSKDNIVIGSRVNVKIKSINWLSLEARAMII